MRLSKALEDKLMDIRLRDKLIAEGKLTKAELDKYISSLSDDSSIAAYTDEKESKKESEEAPNSSNETLESDTSGSDPNTPSFI